MLHSLQQFGKELGRDLVRGWESLTDGWRELLSRSAGALTQFGRKSSGKGELIPADAPSWSLLAGDVVDNGHEVVVRVEMPGIDKADCEIFVDGNTLFVRGEKRFDGTYISGSYHLRQCAYGVFERAIPLPFAVHADKADARFENGVLVVRLPKARDTAPLRIQVHQQKELVRHYCVTVQGESVADKFEYLSSRQFQRAQQGSEGPLFDGVDDNLHDMQDQATPKGAPDVETQPAVSPSRRRPRDRATS